ncbi:Vitamin B12 transporter BtuB [Massilia sp. Bi118]|uniref:TonB-dependent receptor n=1 Tax=Massilia sp. Bi118 TaxID=2822346 RepID=UPI001D7B3E51|nr:TonB-dependent receptor [Massilia sp. Bi118]CAH0307918.1 Vitamin B12 transporter BtuB [Massilia sp. Bi118]
MTTFQLRPVCAAVLALIAHAAFAQSTDASASTAGAANADAPPQTEVTPAAPAQPAQIQQVQVTGLRSSIRSAEAIKRNADQVVDSINAEDIGKFPDRATGDALQRIAGVQVGRDRGETSTVIIRGLPDVVTTIDGNQIFTGNGRRLSYQDLPVQSIGGLDVYKSATANQLEGGIAGAVNVRLRSPFDVKGFSATGFLEDRRQKVNGSSATSDKNNPAGGFAVSNRWNTSYGEIGALVDVQFNRENWGYPVQWVDRPDRIFSVSPDGTAVRLNDDQPIAPLNPGDRLGELPNVGGIYNQGKRDRGSIHGALQWKISPQMDVTAQYLGTGYRARNAVDYILGIVTWTPRLTNVVLAPQGDYCNTPNGSICPIQSAHAGAAQFGGPYDWDPYTATSTWGQKEHTTTHYMNLAVNYRNGPWKASSNFAWTKSTFVNDTVIVDQQIPGASIDVYTYGRDGHGGYNTVTTPTSSAALRDPNQFVLRGMVQNWGISTGEQTQWRFDSSYRLGDGFLRSIDSGIRLSQRRAGFKGAEGHSDISGTRASPIGAFGPSFETLVPGLDRLGGPWMTPSHDFLIDQADTVRAFYGAAPGRVAEDPTRAFSQNENNTTLYLQGRWETKFNEIGVSGTIGGRYMRISRSLLGNSRIGDVISPIDVSSRDNNFLPSASAVISWMPDLQSHISYGKTLTYPDFASLNPALSLIPPTVNAPGTGSAGNPNLSPTRSKNFDATLEYYFPKNGYAQIALFHRDIDGYLQNMESNETIGGLNYRVTRPQNSGSGTLKGAELGIQKFFDFLPGIWSNFGAQANYTWISGENQTLVSSTGNQFTTTPLIGVAKKNYNFALLYEGNGITGRLSATHRGDYVEQIAEPRFGQDRHVKAATFVDLSLSYAITPNISLQFDAINITKEKFESYLNDPIRPRDIRYNPTTYGLGLRFSL